MEERKRGLFVLGLLVSLTRPPMAVIFRMAAVSISFLSRLAYFLPNRCPFFFLFQVVVTRGGMGHGISDGQQ